MTRLFSWRQRFALALLSGGRCEECSSKLTNDDFHADHVVPYSSGGPTILVNGRALCRKCNLRKGARMLQLRPWQEEARSKALDWLLEVSGDRHFLINAAPGSGKTIAACTIANDLIERDEIDRVVVIAPRSEIVNQWARDYYAVTRRFMGKVTKADGDINQLGHDVCATWAAVEGLQDAFHAACSKDRVLVICDEHHHAAVRAAWGDGADSAFKQARFVLVLTGTPIRSDGQQSIWLAYDDEGKIEHPEAGTYTLTYGRAVDLGYCRPVTFHRHEGLFTVNLEGGEELHVSSKEKPVIPSSVARIPALKKVVDFYGLACTPQYEDDKTTPKMTGYQGTMIEAGSAKLTELRHRMPDAGGLVIAPSIEIAEYMVKLIEMIEGEPATLVHSGLPNAENRIQAFRNTDRRWIVSVAMISEGVDVKRLRVLVYLPRSMTELSFRQAIGRVVRTTGNDDDTRAYVVMPSFNILEAYARRVEEEMSAGKRLDPGPAKTKRCPACTTEAPLGAEFCQECGYEFPKAGTRFKRCEECEAPNPMAATKCQVCGHSFAAVFTLTLDEALRTGVIARGMEIDEDETRESEAMADNIRRKILASGDAKMVEFLKLFPEETFAKFKRILDES